MALENSGLNYVIVRPGGMERPTDSYKDTHNVRLSPADTLFGGQVWRLQHVPSWESCMLSTAGSLLLHRCFWTSKYCQRTSFTQTISQYLPAEVHQGSCFLPKRVYELHDAEHGAMVEPFISCPGLQVAGSRAGSRCSGQSQCCREQDPGSRGRGDSSPQASPPPKQRCSSTCSHSTAAPFMVAAYNPIRAC